MIIGAEVGGEYKVDLKLEDEIKTVYFPKGRMIDYDYGSNSLKLDTIESNTDKFILGKYISLDFEGNSFITGRKVKDIKIVRVVFYNCVSDDKINDLENELGKYYFNDYSRALVNTNLLGLKPKFTENKFREYLNSLDLELSMIYNCFCNEGKSDSSDMLVIFNKPDVAYSDMTLKTIENSLALAKREKLKYLYELYDEKYFVLLSPHHNNIFNAVHNQIEVSTLASLPCEFIELKSIDVTLSSQPNQNQVSPLSLGEAANTYKKDIYFIAEKEGVFMYTSADSISSSKTKNVLKYKMHDTYLSFVLDDVISTKDFKRHLRDREYKIGVKITNKMKLTRLKWLKEGKYAK